MAQDERILVVHKAVIDPVRYKERLEATNFDKFLKVLSFSVGGRDWQRSLIGWQIDVALNAIKIGPTLLARQMQSINDQCKGLGIAIRANAPCFWNVYEPYEELLFKDYSGPASVAQLSGAMRELIAFHEFCLSSGCRNEDHMILQRMKALIRKQLGPVFVPKDVDKIARSAMKEAPIYPLEWTALTPEDWKSICRSFLLVCHDNNITTNLGQEIVWMESVVDMLSKLPLPSGSTCKYGPSFYCSFCGGCPSCRCVLENLKALEFNNGDYGKLLPIHQDIHEKFFRIKVPESPEDPSHWGHLAWTFAKFMASQEKSF